MDRELATMTVEVRRIGVEFIGQVFGRRRKRAPAWL